MPTLYRDYRPQKFSEIFGQNHIKITLQNEIEADKVSQAYLFCGPRAVGKTTLARILSRSVNCSNRKEGEHEPCNKCDNCRSIMDSKNLDIIEIDAASNTGVDNVRENIIAFSRLAPAKVKYKVFIIDEVHMLSVSAFNSLLKIIEEPPQYVIFILCTTEIHKVPLTIVSRCERFDFQRISVSDVVKKLAYISSNEKIDIDKEVLEAVARRSGGHLRDAESLLGQIFSLGEKKIGLEQAELVIPHYNSNEAVDLLDYLSKKDAAKAIALINNLVDNGVNIKNFNNELIGLLRKMILSKLSPSLSESLGLDLGESLEKRLSEVSANLEQEQLFRFTRAFLSVYKENKEVSISQLPLELVIAELCFSGGAINISDDRGSFSSSKDIPKKIVKKTVAPKSENIVENKVDNVVESKVRDINQETISLSEAEVMQKWPEVLVKIKKHNHSLSFVLQNCQPQKINAGVMELVFKYKFHQARVNNAAIKEIVEDTLSEVFSSRISIDSSVDESLEIVKSVADEPVEIESVEETPVEAPVKEPSNDSIQPSEPIKSEGEQGNLMSNLLKTFGGEIIS